MPDTHIAHSHAAHSSTECLLRLHDEHHELEDYQSGGRAGARAAAITPF